MHRPGGGDEPEPAGRPPDSLERAIPGRVIQPQGEDAAGQDLSV